LRRRRRALAVAVPALLLGACAAVGPDYVAPDSRAPVQWSSPLDGGLDARAEPAKALAQWWTKLGDPLLSDLERRAVAGNPNLAKAKARLREARARRAISATAPYPTVDARGAGTRSGSGGAPRDLYTTGLDARWELDLFGGKQRALEAAEADAQASEQDLRGTLVSLLAELALDYVDVRTFQSRLATAKANLRIQEETYHIAQWRYQAGLATELEVEQAHYNLLQTRALVPSLQIGLAQSANALAVLLGEPPGSLRDTLARPAPIPVTPLAVAVGVPADALRHRPDVRAAERRLAAQTARIGVATADLYPSLSLVGSIGLEALVPSALLNAAARTFSIGANAKWRAFDAGSIRANIAAQGALAAQALETYRAAVLTALRKVEDAMIAYARKQERRRALIEAAGAAERAVGLARDRYRSGLIDFQVVLDSQRSLLSLQDSLAVSKGAVTSGLVRLYKALGGGWESLSTATVTPTAIQP